ncbi:MAG: hypothetical protein PHE29_09925 [Tissierellia bacterium]|nr:hypothetical protein [Tissierellia bacterium]
MTKLVTTLITLLVFGYTMFAQIKINDTVSCDWTVFDYGNLIIGKQFACDLKITNNSSQKIKIEYLTTH